MDLGELKLDPTREAAGAQLLAMTDRVGFHAYAAAWVRNRDTDAWHFVLVSPMVETRGPKWIYERLLRVFRVVPLPEGITPLEIHVVGPGLESHIFGPLRGGIAVRSAPGSAPEHAAIFKDVRIDNVVIGDGLAAIYRRLPERDRRRDPSNVFDKGVRALEAA
jgi:hypothetical protein